MQRKAIGPRNIFSQTNHLQSRANHLDLTDRSNVMQNNWTWKMEMQLAKQAHNRSHCPRSTERSSAQAAGAKSSRACSYGIAIHSELENELKELEATKRSKRSSRSMEIIFAAQKASNTFSYPRQDEEKVHQEPSHPARKLPCAFNHLRISYRKYVVRFKSQGRSHPRVVQGSQVIPSKLQS